MLTSKFTQLSTAPNFFVPQELQIPTRESDDLHGLLYYMDFKAFLFFYINVESSPVVFSNITADFSFCFPFSLSYLQKGYYLYNKTTYIFF